MLRSLLLSFAVLLAALAPAAAQNPREKKVRDDRVKVEADGFWIYNDLPKATAEAKRTGKPLVVALRCIPCDECVKLDDSLVDTDPVLRPLLEKFVRVRVVSTNGLDLSLFQFDTDQSFAVFLLNADGTVYGRFGTRSHRTNWVGDVSLDGLAKALQGALDLHAGHPKNKPALAAKTGPAPLFPVPEKFPALG
ncbi:MAG: thioredoxin family protein, partial [Ferruginibacter sp.]|nr:thioredoxin family protein [Chitinophagaceae bacterium]